MIQVLLWWSENGRCFPWRQTVDPFRVLIAELLLQRSRSGSVAKVYLEIFERWPTPAELATADDGELDRLVGPLGLKNRAAKVKAIATRWTDLDPKPANVAELQEFPGVGHYMANATAVAMSWNASPCVDSVSIRVLRRYLGNDFDTDSDQQVASTAYAQIPEYRWRELNWAILDLAAALCMPRIPKCQRCPLENHCKWAEKHRQKHI